MIAWYYLAGYAAIVLISWFVAWILNILRENKTLKADYANLKKQHDKLLVDYVAIQEEHTEDMIVDYSIMAGLIEEHTTQLADVHKELDELVSRVDQLGNIHIRIAPLMPLPEYEYAEPHEEDAMTPTLPLPLVDWVAGKEMEGLDEL